MREELRGSEIHAGGFDYRAAFSRNIGWITEWEQQELRRKTVAIAGLGGVGGAHALTLARLGIGGFHLADFDRFDVVNFNRQSAAFLSTLGQEKTGVTGRMVRDINPELRVKVFDRGIDERNLDDFLAGVDVFVDGLDFFVIDIRRKVFKRCAELGIPAITAAPIGLGSCYLIFMPGGMTFEQYFRLEGLPQERQYVKFGLGLAPKGFHRQYLIDPSRMDLAHRRGPSTAAAVQICAGVTAAETVKILLGRGKVYAVPHYHAFDAYLGRWKRGKLRFGNAGLLQSLKRQIGYRVYSRLSRHAYPSEATAQGSEIENIIELARWAPSGDNAQPWRFEMVGQDRLIVRIHAEGESDNIYDYADGRPTLLSGGFLLETLRIAASRFQRAMSWTYLGSEVCEHGIDHRIEVALPKSAELIEDPRFAYIPIRSVDRRRYRDCRLTREQKTELENSLGDQLSIEWRETLGERWKLARLGARATDIRLRSKETFAIHQRILDWDRRFSPDGVPAAAVGLDPLTLSLMRWVMKSWERTDFMCRFLVGTSMPRVQLDLLPGIYCGAFFIIRSRPDSESNKPRALLEAGSQLQRFWLTATLLGLVVQPTFAPLCFAYYGQTTRSAVPTFKKFAASAANCIPGIESVVFLGRIGVPKRTPVTARSVRRRVEDFIMR